MLNVCYFSLFCYILLGLNNICYIYQYLRLLIVCETLGYQISISKVQDCQLTRLSKLLPKNEECFHWEYITKVHLKCFLNEFAFSQSYLFPKKSWGNSISCWTCLVHWLLLFSWLTQACNLERIEQKVFGIISFFHSKTS